MRRFSLGYVTRKTGAVHKLPPALLPARQLTVPLNFLYSLRSASIGFRVAALTDGSRPKTMPISMENPTLAAAAGILMIAGVPLVLAINWDKIIPAITPMIPPQLVSTADSVKN